MIVTVTLNAAVDRTLTVPNFQFGHRHRASSSLTSAGGKGINVARALKRLEAPVVATGLAGGRTGDRIVEDLGLAPGPELVRLEAAILAQDPSLLGHDDAVADPAAGGRAAAQAAVGGVAVPVGTIPRAAASILGRDAELRAALELIDRADVPLVTLTCLPHALRLNRRRVRYS